MDVLDNKSFLAVNAGSLSQDYSAEHWYI